MNEPNAEEWAELRRKAHHEPTIEEWAELRAKFDRTLCDAEMGDPVAVEKIVPIAEELSKAALRFRPEPSQEPKIDALGAVEMAHCALVNLDNLAKNVPRIAKHPMFMVVKYQLAEAVRLLGREV